MNLPAALRLRRRLEGETGDLYAVARSGKRSLRVGPFYVRRSRRLPR